MAVLLVACPDTMIRRPPEGRQGLKASLPARAYQDADAVEHAVETEAELAVPVVGGVPVELPLPGLR
jgi:hypothetical protein